MSDEVVIEHFFRGPPESANGGYACGVLAAHVEAPAAEVTLRSPPPLDRKLAVVGDGGGARLLEGEQLIAEARPTEVPELDFPAPVSPDDAVAAGRDYDHSEHPFPMCFVCGPDRASDGLGVLCGPVGGRESELVAGGFEARDWMADGGGQVRPELIWAALDCPGGISMIVLPELEVVYVLGRLTAHLVRPVEVGQKYAAIGWPVANDGRKMTAGSAILDREGEPRAFASAVWIRLRDDAPPE